MLRRWLGRSEQTTRRVAIRPGDCSVEVAPDLTVRDAPLRAGWPEWLSAGAETRS